MNTMSKPITIDELKKNLEVDEVHLPKEKGFTLIELMIAVGVVAILATIAYPTYAEYMKKTRRVDATTEVMIAAQILERCYTQFNNVYNHPNCRIQSGVAFVSAKGFYTITPVTTAKTYTLMASPFAGGPQVTDVDCTSFTYNHLGQQTATSNKCW